MRLVALLEENTSPCWLDELMEVNVNVVRFAWTYLLLQGLDPVAQMERGRALPLRGFQVKVPSAHTLKEFTTFKFLCTPIYTEDKTTKSGKVQTFFYGFKNFKTLVLDPDGESSRSDLFFHKKHEPTWLKENFEATGKVRYFSPPGRYFINDGKAVNR